MTDVTQTLPDQQPLFTDDEIDQLISYYGDADKFIDALRSTASPDMAPVEVVNHWISRIIVYYFHGWFPESSAKRCVGTADIRSQRITSIFADEFGVVDTPRMNRIRAMVTSYQLSYETMSMEAPIGKGLGWLSIALPGLTFGVIPATCKMLPEGSTHTMSVIGTASPKVEVVPMKFAGADKIGDFSWMIKQPEYQQDLFIFNDNEASNRDYRYRWVSNHQTSMSLESACVVGAGNAIIRPYRCLPGRKDRPQSAGLPTGFQPVNEAQRGYQTLGEAHIGTKWAMEYITTLVKSGQYRRVYFSVGEDGLLGQGVFTIDLEVREYLTKFLLDLANIT